MLHRGQPHSIGSVLVVLGTVMAVTVSALCPTPRCATYDEINTLWTDPDPAHYQQCRPSPNGTWYLQQMTCASGTLFSYDRQVCVRPAYWTDCAVAPTAPDVVPCEAPRCITFAEIGTLWVHRLREKYYQCRPVNGTWVPQEMLCAPGTLFSFKHQVCVHQAMWQSSCYMADSEQ
ncbi:uncharacterized protein LOC128718537 [Anopheles marshallii]|uniref:uncharacterized protein LOC128718537 n=1 Tax=Anopheles marshallii TaxID=1521116 RepID=UPI00237B694E|nr:uncharacterized protein LOC128718537 [Anopheles marshallii]